MKRTSHPIIWSSMMGFGSDVISYHAPVAAGPKSAFISAAFTRALTRQRGIFERQYFAPPPVPLKVASKLPLANRRDHLRKAVF